MSLRPSLRRIRSRWPCLRISRGDVLHLGTQARARRACRRLKSGNSSTTSGQTLPATSASLSLQA